MQEETVGLGYTTKAAAGTSPIAQEKDLRRLINRADCIGGDLNQTYDRIVSLRHRLQGSPPEDEKACVESPCNGSELSEFENILSRLQRTALEISDVLSDLERI